MVDRPAGPQMRIPLGADLRLALDGLIADTGLRASRIIDGALDYAIERCAPTADDAVRMAVQLR